MAIIVEGFDNCGKSTLARAFGLEIVHPGPAPRNRWEENHCIEAQAKMARLPVVMDRVTCISSQVYRDNRLFEPQLQSALNDLLATHHCIVIYCRPPIAKVTDFSTHNIKSHDKPDYVNWLKKNALPLVSKYDQLMATIPHMKYDWTDPDADLIQAALDSQFTIGAWKKCQDRMSMIQRA